MFFRRSKPTASDRKIAALEKRVLDLESVVEERNRQIRILEAERDSLSEVIARDRLRVKAESATFAATVANATGVK